MGLTPFRADLHCHTTCSDGTYSPTDLIQLAIDQGLSGLSITDHDTIKAYAEAIPIALSKKLPLLTGVEFSSMHEEQTVHILGYGFSLTSPSILEMCAQHCDRRRNRLLAILERLHSKKLFLNEEEIYQFTQGRPNSVGRPHIAQALIAKRYVASFQEAFDLYLGERASCYVRDQLFSSKDTIKAIHEGGGAAIIAHPHLIKKKRILTQLLSMPFDGIEVYYAAFSLSQNERWLQIAAQKKWLITGGSDFHGEIKPHLPLGSSWISQEPFNALMEFRWNS